MFNNAQSYNQDESSIHQAAVFLQVSMMILRYRSQVRDIDKVSERSS